MITTSCHTSRIGVLEKVGYGLGDTASNIVFQMVMLFMPFFYTDVFGISTAVVGTLLLVVRVVDAIIDPMIGALCDRTETRWGKFRPYLLWLCVPYAVFAVLAFTTPQFTESGKLVYAYITYGLLMLVYTGINVPYCALGGVITGDSQERISLNSYRFALATAAGILIASCTLPLVDWLGDGDQQRGFPKAMVVFSLLAVMMFITCFALTKERVTQASRQRPDLWKDLTVLFSNDQWWVVAALSFVVMIGLVLRGGAAAYYMLWYATSTWFENKNAMITAFLTTGMIAQCIGAALAFSVVRFWSHVAVYGVIQLVIAIASALMYLLYEDQIFPMFVTFALVQFLAQLTSPILWGMMADTVDYGEFKTGRRITGLTYSGSLFSLKLGMAIGGALFGWLLSAFAYQSNSTTQSPSAVRGIVLTFTLFPAMAHFLVALIVTKYKLTPRRFAEIRSTLASRVNTDDAVTYP